MAKKKKYEKINEIVTYDGDGNITRQKLTGNTGGYTRETTPALSTVSQTIKPTVKESYSPLVTVGKTLGNVATNMGTGALKNLEGVADFVSDKVTNPTEQKLNYVYDYITKGKKTANENLADLIKMQERDIKKNRTEEFLKKTGYSDIADEWEKGSLVKSGNFAGKVAQGVGGMVPSLVMGGALGGEAALTDLSKLSGKEKALAALGNVGKTYAAQLPANVMLGASSYGSGMEEALNDGATMDQARKFGLANMAIEQGTEMLTGGVPGLGGKGGIDSFVDPLIDKNTKGLTKAALKTLYRAGGEGLEESAAALLNPLAKKIYSDEKINWKDVGRQALEEGLVGAATGAILSGPQTAFDFQQANLERHRNTVQNLNDVQREALIEVTNKRKQGIPLDQNDYAVIGAINNTVNNMVDAQRGQNFEDNLQLQPQQNVQDNELRVEPVDTKTNKEVTKTNDLNEYIEDVATREALQNEKDRNAIRQSITEYLEDNNITNPTKEDMLNAMDDYNMMDNAEDITDLRKAQRLYNEVADEMLKESPKVEEKVETTKSNKFKNLTTTDEARLNKIYDIQRKGEKLSQNQVEELQYLERKEKGLKFPELTKSDQVNKADYAKYYAKANMDNFDSTMLNKAKDIVQPNKQGRRTKQQWLDIAENIGNQASNMDAESLKRYAYESFKEAQPNQAENLNRQGEKYVKFGVQEWVNSVYDGAGVGTKNIAEKKADSVITVKNKQGQELKLKQDKTNPNVYKREVKIPKDNKSIVPKETMQKQLAKLKDGTKVSNFYSNLTENSKFITQENASKLSQEEIWRYAPQTNKETMANAEARIGDTQKSLEAAYGDFLSKNENFSPEDVGVGWILLKRFQDAGNYDAMVQVAKKMRNIATKSGQTVQMFNLQSRLTPEGMVKYAQSELMEAEQQFNKGKSQKEIDKYAKDFELTGEEVEFIKNQMEKIQDMPDGREKNIEMAKINKMLSDKLPHKRGDSIKAWMRISMLFNPKTQVRNVVGNALITPINAIADVPASIADKAISRKTGTRTIGAPSLGGLATYGKGFARGGVEAWQDYRTGLDTKDVDMSRFDITQKSPFVTDHKGAASVLNPVSKGLNKANAFLDLVMSGGDRVFYQGAFDASLRNQMQLNNVDTPTQDMIDIATQEALSRTWNDNNGYTQFVLNTRRALNKASIGGYGLGDVLIPFAKTPANLTKAIYDYSPVGLTSTLFKTKSIQNAIETGQITPQMQHDFAQNLGKGVAGTMLYAMAYALAKSGMATGSGDDDKDVANFIKNTMGIQPYSIKVGNKSFTYDWAQPVAAPLAIATDAYKNLTNKSEEDTMTRVFNTILDVSNTGFNVLMQQSFLQGISEVLNSNEGVANGIMEQVIGLPARAVPTFVQQINNMFDKTQRVAFEKNQPLKTGKQNVMSKLPGQSEKLAPRVDALGNEVQRYGDSKSEITYALKNFLSPANQSNRQTSKAAEEIYKVYEATGDKTIMPMVAPYYIQNKTVGRIDLDSKDRATYQKISGKLVNDAVIELTNDSDYKNLSYDEKAEVLNGIVSYSNAKAKEHFTGFMANTYNPANKKINNGMSIADYYLEKTMNKR